MAAKQINIYAELSPELSSDVTDLKQVLKAIDAKIVWYNRRINNPKYKTQVPIKVKMLNALKEQITENPAIIRQHAVAYAEIAREQQAERERLIRRKGALFVSGGMIPQANLKQLAKESGMSEAEILKLLGVKVKTKRTFSYKDDGIPELDRSDMNAIAEQLKILGKKDLYEFLGVSPGMALAEIMKSVDNKAAWVSGNSNKTDVRVNATSALVKSCIFVFRDDKNRRSYEKALENAGFVEVRSTIAMFKTGGSRLILPDQYRKLLDMCTRNGIPKEKAEAMIHIEAEKIGVEVEDGSAGELEPCRFCGALNDCRSSACHSCGMPLSMKCPKCGRPVAAQDYRCTACGFSIIGMKDARLHIEVAQVALEEGDIDNAVKEYHAAEVCWPGCPELGRMAGIIAEKKAETGRLREKVRQLCGNKRYYEAKRYIGAFAVNEPLRKEVEDVLDNVEDLLNKANASSDGNVRLDCYLRVLSVCSDCREAEEKLKMISLAPPSGMQTVVHGRNIRLSWQKGASDYISYKIVRKENACPVSITDGKLIGTTGNSSFDDTTAQPGVSYYYAVYSCFKDKQSGKAALSLSPVMRVEELDSKIIRVIPNETSLEFDIDFPKKLYAIEIYREGKLVKTLMGTSFVDSGLVTRHTYSYRFVAVYQDSAKKKHRSAGLELQLVPMPRPQGTDLVISGSDEHKVTFSWQAPRVGTLNIYYADEPFSVNKNDIISVDTFRAQRLNVAGTSCVVNKDFCGERFFIPVTIQGNMGVVGTGISITSMAALKGVSFNLGERGLDIKWQWDGTEAVRVRYSFDGITEKVMDVVRSRSAVPGCRLSVPKTAKAVKVEVMAVSETARCELVGPAITKLFNLKAVRVSFNSVENKRRFGLIASDRYVIGVETDSPLPCDLHLLIREKVPPINLVHYRPAAVIRSSDVTPGRKYEVVANFSRKDKKHPLYFRLIAADRGLAKQIIVMPEIRQIN